MPTLLINIESLPDVECDARVDLSAADWMTLLPRASMYHLYANSDVAYLAVALELVRRDPEVKLYYATTPPMLEKHRGLYSLERIELGDLGRLLAIGKAPPFTRRLESHSLYALGSRVWSSGQLPAPTPSCTDENLKTLNVDVDGLSAHIGLSAEAVAKWMTDKAAYRKPALPDATFHVEVGNLVKQMTLREYLDAWWEARLDKLADAKTRRVLELERLAKDLKLEMRFVRAAAVHEISLSGRAEDAAAKMGLQLAEYRDLSALPISTLECVNFDVYAPKITAVEEEIRYLRYKTAGDFMREPMRLPRFAMRCIVQTVFVKLLPRVEAQPVALLFADKKVFKMVDYLIVPEILVAGDHVNLVVDDADFIHALDIDNPPEERGGSDEETEAKPKHKKKHRKV